MSTTVQQYKKNGACTYLTMTPTSVKLVHTVKCTTDSHITTVLPKEIERDGKGPVLLQGNRSTRWKGRSCYFMKGCWLGLSRRDVGGWSVLFLLLSSPQLLPPSQLWGGFGILRSLLAGKGLKREKKYLWENLSIRNKFSWENHESSKNLPVFLT